jgi:cell division protein FtsN
MNDKDKGTYSPPTEDHLSYETRKTPVRDQAPITLIISGICLVVLLLAVVVFYNSNLNNHGKTPPDVGDTVGDIKDGKVEDAKPLTDQDINDGDAASAHFAPTTEAPGDRGDASVAAIDQAPPPVAPIQGPLPSQANNAAIPGTPAAASAAAASSSAGKAAPSLALKGAVPSTANATAAVTKPAQVAAVKPLTAPVTKPGAAKTVAATKPAASGGAVVQIGAYESQAIADKQYASIASSYGLFLSGTGKHIEKVDTANGPRFRTQFTGFATADKARAFCSALKAASHDCFVK